MRWRLFSWRGFGNGHGSWPSHCWVFLARLEPKRQIVVLDDTGNPGTSVTNCIEWIAPLIAEQFVFDPLEADWYEYVRLSNRFDRIELVSKGTVPVSPTQEARAFAVRWRPATREEDAMLRSLVPNLDTDPANLEDLNLAEQRYRDLKAGRSRTYSLEEAERRLRD
jgi:hypothetical protein